MNWICYFHSELNLNSLSELCVYSNCPVIHLKLVKCCSHRNECAFCKDSKSFWIKWNRKLPRTARYSTPNTHEKTITGKFVAILTHKSPISRSGAVRSHEKWFWLIVTSHRRSYCAFNIQSCVYWCVCVCCMHEFAMHNNIPQITMDDFRPNRERHNLEQINVQLAPSNTH